MLDTEVSKEFPLKERDTQLEVKTFYVMIDKKSIWTQERNPTIRGRYMYIL